ncbi:helix-turn-helix domain-containing protein [Anaerotignum sp.]|uniref:helix-turn-helix domain-containing protein n=1 Tax=Anaerotignum sp. TaxID=2039241 RepID=UPI00289D14D0|nr:helix-turn-helix transcriptional regulator [Anaerotignum sp.]
MLGEKLKEIRVKRGFTQKDLAEKTGLATITIQGYEANKFKPKLETLEKIAEILSIPISYFFISDMKPDEQNNVDRPSYTGTDSMRAFIESKSSGVPMEYLLGKTNISDTDLFNFFGFSDKLKSDNILRAMNTYDYSDEVIQGFCIMLGNLFKRINSHVWNGKPPIKYNDLDNIYLLSIILNIFLESAVNAKKTAGGIEENTLDNIKNDLNDKLLPVIDAWINNYLKPARQLPHYENEIKQFNKK